MVSRISDALTLTDNAAGLAAWEAFGEDPMAAIWLTAFLVSVRQSARTENLDAIVEALAQNLLPATDQIRQLAALSHEELRERLPSLDTLPLIQRAGLLNLIAKVREEDTRSPTPSRNAGVDTATP
jgi:hypothetical protein